MASKVKNENQSIQSIIDLINLIFIMQNPTNTSEPREIPVKFENPSISGRIDFLIRHQEHGISPIELKSINTSGFSKLSKPKDEHSLQLQMYLNMGNYDIGTVLYENKNDQKIKSFIVKRDIKQWDDLLSRCFNIQNMVEPPMKCTGPAWCNCKHVNMDEVKAKISEG